MKTQVLLEIRAATEEDCRPLWEWANDPQVRASAFSSNPIPWEEHAGWFKKKRSDPNCVLYIVLEQGGSPIGQVRFDCRADGSAETDMSIVRDHRGKGIGTRALRLACRSVQKLGRAQRIVAFIKPENLASLRTFEAAGFSTRGRTSVRGHEVVWMDLESR